MSNVVWCTGFDPDFRWIQSPMFDEDGYPIHYRGVVEGEPGLYFVGLLFLYSLTSSLIGGWEGTPNTSPGTSQRDRRPSVRAGEATISPWTPSRRRKPVVAG